MRYLFIISFIFLAYSCKPSEEKGKDMSKESDATTVSQHQKDKNDISAISTKDFREFKVLDSKYINTNELWDAINADLNDFSEQQYQALKPLILEQDIPTLQNHMVSGKLSYENLTKFYLYRIQKFDRDNPLSLNSVISINPNVIAEARQKDMELLNKKLKHPIFGMPILLKDNINTAHMPTTAGAVALQNNTTKDAFIVRQLKAKGALILGKANLSEWAYFFCGDCPSGYSAIGGQTLNPYGRRVIDTGGSSSGSGVATAANFCVAAIGSETAGSILSPASQNSVVGLKPTVGLLSRSGIVPISSTLDTAGPITKNVTDNSIVLDALFGEDKADPKAIYNLWESPFYYRSLKDVSLKGKRFGAFKKLMEDELYAQAVEVLKQEGAEVIEVEALDVKLPEFIRLLNLDMKKDLAAYLADYGNSKLGYASIEDIMAFNQTDSLNVMPYGQKLFHGISEDASTDNEFEALKTVLKTNGQRFFDEPMTTHNLDGILSVNNYHAGFAAVAEYPALTVPMGYTEDGVPKGLTFISSRLREKQLLEWAYVYEQASKMRKAPESYN
ncbi:amidase family protein [Psychroserpens algicola]|uniref:Amidase family protein n=1 Tax=Psychroserpens algicola TaxID=1719034 RepID=A0ABT0H719_9FLAO|nr:amidase family protein [Psychroserpens algicola]MCK8479632.1 amidase family protein [Psychroserpens algicola]